MTNLSLTSECNQNCSYCFAGNMTDVNRFPRREYDRFLAFLTRSGIKQVRLLGGEPTLHPDFVFFVKEAFRQGFHVLVFSNGMMPESAVKCLESLPPDKLLVLVNASPSRRWNMKVRDRRIEVLNRLNQKVMIGLTIHSPNPDIDSICSYIDTLNLRPAIRLGLAHPCPDGTNQWLPPKHYYQVGQILADFIIRHPDLSIEFDCGFVPCMFPDWFFAQSVFKPEDIGRRCGPIPDILPDGSVVHCFPLRAISKLTLDQLACARAAGKELSRMAAPYQHTGIFPECACCGYRTADQCSGGCIAAAGRRLRSSSQRFSLSMPHGISIASGFTGGEPSHSNGAPENVTGVRADKHFIIPYIDQPPHFWKEVYNAHGRFIKKVYCPLPGNKIGSGRPPQPGDHLHQFLRSDYFETDILINSPFFKEPLDDFTNRVIKELRLFSKKYPLAGVTIANPEVGRRIREVFPDLSLTASVLMDVYGPDQIKRMGDIFDCLVPSSRIMRNINALNRIRQAFAGKIRLIANEACLPDCPYREQHFYEMNSNCSYPESLCTDLLKEKPWLRLTGAWVLPQHLPFFDTIYDQLKLAGRVTLKDPAQYIKVLDAYITGTPLAPDEIGGGPASVLNPVAIDSDFYFCTLNCDKQCHQCDICRTYYERQTNPEENETEKVPV